MPNQVVLTFAGETKDIEDSFNRAGAAAKKAGDDVGASSDGFRRAGEAADEVDTKAMGFRDTMTGVQDTLKGTSMLMKGPSFEGFVTLGAGIGDLGSGFYNLLIPAISKATAAFKASTLGQKAAAAATRVVTAAQWLWNAAQLASPTTWIIAGIVALIAVIVLIATKTDWFQRAWRASWKWIQSSAKSTWEYIKKIPGWIATAFSTVGRAISAPFRASFNAIARAWNNTVGRLSWSVPGWVPGIGGNSISVPNLPTFHAGGVVGGVVGSPQLTVLQGGEKVGSVASRGDNGGWVSIRGDAVMDGLVRAIASAVDAKGGRAAQLGIRFT
jgi:hypothetical protein